MKPTAASDRPEWLESLLSAWLVHLAMIVIGVGLWLWVTARSVRDHLRTLRCRFAVKGKQP